MATAIPPTAFLPFFVAPFVLADVAPAPAPAARTNPVPYVAANPMIDEGLFARESNEVAALRATRRVSEADFLKMAGEADTVVLDARNPSMFKMLHVKGAKNMDLTLATASSLEKAIPSKATRILIYCNNNFLGAPRSMEGKAISASLNLYTFRTLYAYGYREVYELGPALHVDRTVLPLEGDSVGADGKVNERYDAEVRARELRRERELLKEVERRERMHSAASSASPAVPPAAAAGR